MRIRNTPNNMAEAGVEHTTDFPEKTPVGSRLVQNTVQVPADVVEIASAVARLPAKRRSELLAIIKASDPALGKEEAKR
jgi:hypothetical protein